MLTDLKNKWYARVATTMAAMMALVGWAKDTDIPIDATTKQLNLDDEQKAKLQAAFGDKFNDVIEAINHELKTHHDSNSNLKAISDEIQAILKEKNALTEELTTAKDKNAEETLALQIKALTDAHKGELDKLKAEVRKLAGEGVGDVPEAIVKLAAGKFNHTATHLFGIADPYNAFDKRPWNTRAKNFGVSATNFISDANIPTLQGDLEHFVRENPDVINSWFNDMEELPAQWSRRSGVIDMVTSGSMAVGEIVQARKMSWQPKNKFKFATETRRVYRKQIDISFSGYQLQELETTWVGRLKSMDGSQPWKMNFIGFLLSEIAKQQRVDDRIAQINGIYAVDPQEKNPGKNLHSQNGLRYYWWYYRDVVKKYRPATINNMPEPTPENIVDYVEELIKTIPEEYRNMSGLEIQMSNTLLEWYRNKAGKLYQLHLNTDQGKAQYTLNHPIDRTNFMFQPLKDQTKTKFIGITFSENIEVLDYNADERGKMTIVHEKRDTHIFADYRQGIGFIEVGMEAGADDPVTFQKQILWSNDQPIFDREVIVPLFDDKSGKIAINFNNLEIDENFNTDITDVTQKTELTPGMVIRIKGNPNAATTKKLKSNTKFLLTSDFSLNSNQILTLFVQEDLKLKEISRKDAVSGAPTDVFFTGTVLDQTEGKVFRNANEANITITDITGGVEGVSIKVYGNSDTTTTIQSVADKISVGGTAVILTQDSHYIQLTFIDGIWIKTNLSNA